MMMMMAGNGGGKPSTGTMKSSYNGGGMNTSGRRNTGPSSMRPSTSVGHLSSFGDGGYSPPRQTAFDDDGGSVQGKKIKRTKSMWKFKKTGSSDEVLTGMSMWKHRSLVDVNAAEAEEQQQLQNTNNANNYNNKSSTGTPVANKKFTITCRDIDIAGNGGGFAAVDDDDSQTIMNGGTSTVRRMTYDNRKQQHHQQTHRSNDRMSRRSSSSSFGGDDSESCIVVDDHLKDARTAGSGHPVPSPASLLPRTRLIKQTGSAAATAVGGSGGGPSSGAMQQQQQITAVGSSMLLPPPPPPAVRTATGNDGYQHDSDVDVRFESSKLQTFKYINANNNDGWYDSWGEKRKK